MRYQVQGTVNALRRAGDEEYDVSFGAACRFDSVPKAGEVGNCQVFLTRPVVQREGWYDSTLLVNEVDEGYVVLLRVDEHLQRYLPPGWPRVGETSIEPSTMEFFDGDIDEVEW